MLININQAWKRAFKVLFLFATVIFLDSCEDEPIAIEEMDAPASAVGDQVSISNAGFESNWSGWTEIKTNGDHTSISDNSNSGDHSAKINDSGGRFERTLSVNSNTQYTLSAYVRGSWRIGAEYGGNRTTRSGNASDWEEETVTFSTGSATSVTILGEYNSGIGRFDDFTLTEGASSGGGGGGSSDYTSIPSKIEAEDFDDASEGRTEDTSDSGGGVNIGWIDSGEFLSYNVDVPSSGEYTINFRVASLSAGINFDIYQDNSKIGNVSSSATGDWQSWKTVSETVNLSSGDRTIKIQATAGGWNINWLEFEEGDDDGGGGEDPGSSVCSFGGSAVPSGNLAYGKDTDQSSTYTGTGGESCKAVDGNTSGNWGDQSITHTQNQSNPWWEVDLGSNESIGDIVIHNRTNCCSSRLSNFTVSVLNSSGNTQWSQNVGSLSGSSITLDANGATGRTVRIEIPGSGKILSLAEVQVYEHDGDDGGGSPPSSGGSVEDILGSTWKITMPYDDSGDDSGNVSDPDDRNNDAAEYFDLEDAADDFPDIFYVSGDEVIFTAHAGGATTSGSIYPRTELRQLDNSGDDSYWSTDDYQYLDVTVRVLELPVERPEVNMVQIHGPDDEPLRVEYNAGSDGLHLTINDEDDGWEDVIDYSLGDRLRVRVTVNDDKMTLQLNNLDNGDSYNLSNQSITDNEGYFKVGCYLQSSVVFCEEKGKSSSECTDDQPDAQGTVAVSDLTLVSTW